MGLAEGVVLVDALKDKIKAELDRANVTLQDVQVRTSHEPRCIIKSFSSTYLVGREGDACVGIVC